MVKTMNRRFEQRSVLVTGGLGGIGLATAQRLAAEGAQLAFVDLAIDDSAATSWAWSR